MLLIKIKQQYLFWMVKTFGPKYRELNKMNWSTTENPLIFLLNGGLLKYFSEWKDWVKELVVDRISGLKGIFKSPKCKILNLPDVKDTLEKLHTDFVLFLAHKAANNVIMMCEKYYIIIIYLSFLNCG